MLRIVLCYSALRSSSLSVAALHVLAVERSEGAFRIEMWDSSERRPEKRDLANSAEMGRGLHLVEALSTAWGYRLAASGKCVWAVLGVKGGDQA